MELSSIQVEKSFLGGLIKNPDVFPDIENFINEKVFTSHVHSIIFNCFRSSYLNHEKVDEALLSQKIKNLGISFKDGIEIFNYIEAICFTQITQEALIDAAKELAKLYALRQMIDTADEIKDAIFKSGNNPLQITISKCDKLYGDKINSFGSFSEPENLFDDILDIVEERGNNPTTDIGLITQFPSFNKLYGGLRGGNIYAVASRTGEGKTTFLNEIAIGISKLHKIPVLILDTEMDTQSIKFRQAAAKSDVGLYYLETGLWRKNKEMVEKVRTSLKDIKNQYKIFHQHVGNKDIDSIMSIARRWYFKNVERGQKALIIYDYLKLTGEKVGANWAEYQAMGQKVDKLKRLSEDLNCPIFTAIQINRMGENTNKNSANVTDDASVISISDRISWFVTSLFIFRRKTSDEIIMDTPISGTHKLIELKARFQGAEAKGHKNFIKRLFPDGSEKYVKNYINFNIDNFRVEERGDLNDAINRQNHSHLVTDINPIKNDEETLE